MIVVHLVQHQNNFLLSVYAVLLPEPMCGSIVACILAQHILEFINSMARLLIVAAKRYFKEQSSLFLLKLVKDQFIGKFYNGSKQPTSLNILYFLAK